MIAKVLFASSASGKLTLQHSGATRGGPQDVRRSSVPVFLEFDYDSAVGTKYIEIPRTMVAVQLHLLRGVVYAP